MEFTRYEINLMCIYGNDSRVELIRTLSEMREYLTPEEWELRELTDSTLEKLEKISDAEFDKLDLIPDFDEE